MNKIKRLGRKISRLDTVRTYHSVVSLICTESFTMGLHFWIIFPQVDFDHKSTEDSMFRKLSIPVVSSPLPRTHHQLNGSSDIAHYTRSAWAAKGALNYV